MRTTRVVAADTCFRRAAEVQSLRELVRVRAGRRIHDRMGASDDLELVVTPLRAFRAFVRAVTDRLRLLVERPARIASREDELDHLPVALVQVVEDVERIEEPVLQCELLRVARVSRDVRVHGGSAPRRESARPAFVVAAGIKRVAREVEVVVVPVDRDPRRKGRSSPGPWDSRARVARPSVRRRERRRLSADTARRDRTPRLARPAGRPGRSARRALVRRRDRRPRRAESTSAATADSTSTTTHRCVGGRRFTVGFRDEEIQPQPSGQELGRELSLHAVTGGVEQRRERPKSALARRDGDDPAPDATLPRQSDVVQPVARGFVEPSGRHHRKRVTAGRSRR